MDLKSKLLPEIQLEYSTRSQRVFNSCCNNYSEVNIPYETNTIHVNDRRNYNATIQAQINAVESQIKIEKSKPDLFAENNKTIPLNSEVIPQLQKPENQGLLLLAGLVAAMFVLN